MGKGKGSIDHYVTPVKAGRIIVEMGGHIDFEEVKPLLQEVRASATTRESIVVAIKVISDAQGC